MKGLFLGGRYAFKPSENTSLDFMLENNGWDWNAGAVDAWRGIFAGLYATEIEEGGKSPSHGSMYTDVQLHEVQPDASASTRTSSWRRRARRCGRG